mgnify:FL=1
MRTGLITFHFAHHYGAQLQALATMKAIQRLGHECQIIDYRLPHTTRTNQLFKKSTSVRDMASDAHTALHYTAFQRRFQRFEAFVAEEMELSPQRYTDFRQLQDAPPAYDVYVSGSDQIWNPYIFQTKQFDPAFLLDFVQEGRRIAYAPSLGVPQLPEDKAAELKRFLAPFSALSVREKRGQVLVRQAAQREAKVVLDPTLLLSGEDWGKLAAAPKHQGPYILCYFVSDPGEAAPYAQALSRQTGWPIVQLAGARRKIDGAREIVFDAGPREFLGLFQHAAAVVTNSFHGAAFSLQFRKDFFTSMSPKERREPTFSRIYSLLSRLGCADRIIGLDTTAPIDAKMDYDQVYEKLEAARADSLAYLKAAVEGTALPEEMGAAQEQAKPNLCKAEDCTGCTACAAVCPVGAIEMKPDHEGFLRPVVGEKCILCRKCENACPALTEPVKGPDPNCAHGVWNKNDEVRSGSSSGGVFSLLAGHVLDQGGVVYGAAFDGYMAVRHTCAASMEEVAAMRGSKYVQSDLGETFHQVKEQLEAGKPVLFTGLACQVDGLKHYLGRDYDNLLTCDLVCNGVPSPAVFQAYLKKLGMEHGAPVTGLRFRDKAHGWSHSHMTVRFADGGSTTTPLHRTTFGRGFGMQLFLRPVCAKCRYTSVSRPADLTLGDFWGLDPKLKLPTDREKGVSLVLVNSAKGQKIFDALEDKLGQVERPLAEAVAGNPRLAYPLTHNAKRGAFFAAFAAMPFDQVEQKYLTPPPLPYRAASKVLTPKMKEKIRKILK